MELYKEGSKGAIVKQIQKVAGAYPDGIWGKITTECVKAWQRAHDLTADGIAGPATLAEMGISAISGFTAQSSKRDSFTSNFSGQSITLRKSKRKINEIIIHCTATPEGQNMTVEQIRAQHKAQGWSDIGYHYVIYRDGTVHEGRDVDIAGAHCTNHNAHSIGIVYVGGLESKPGVPYNQLKAKDTRTLAQKSSLVYILMDLRRLYPGVRIRGHRDFAQKDCPSFDATWEYRHI